MHNTGKMIKEKSNVNSHQFAYRLLLVVGPFFLQSCELFLLCALHSLHVSYSSVAEQVVSRVIIITIRETRLSCLFLECVVLV